jgi:hypothetical protein
MTARTESLYEDYVHVKGGLGAWKRYAILILVFLIATWIYFVTSPDAMNVSKITADCNTKLAAANAIVAAAGQPCPCSPLNSSVWSGFE